MATIIERPQSAFRMSSSPNVLPQRRSRDSVEVIDVDSFEDFNTRPAQRRRVEQQPPDIIELLDSDEEVGGGSGTEGGSRRDDHGTRQRNPSSAVASGFGSSSIPVNGSRRQSSGAGGVAGSSRLGHHRRFFSPPPQPSSGGNFIPPVPPLPRRFSAFQSMPVPRPRGPRVPPPPSSGLNNNGPSSSSTALADRVPGPVRPTTQPFAFELSSSPPPMQAPYSSDEEEFEFRPAPRARHNPPMGLGGALISSNNARLAAERAERQRRNERRAAGGRVAPAIAQAVAGGSGSGGGGSGGNTPRRNAGGPGFLRRLATGLNPFRWGDDDTQQRVNDVNLPAFARPYGGNADDGDERTRGDAQLALDLYLRDQEDAAYARMFAHPARGFARRELALLRGWAGGRTQEQEDYKKEWTHPGNPDPGFVFDFAPSEIVPPVKGKGKGKEVVIDVDAEKEKEGVSTLLVCARCLDPLLVRADGVISGGEEEARRRKVWGLRCGHLIDGKCFEVLRKPLEPAAPDGEDEANADTSGELKLDVAGDPKGKGKGKAKAHEAEDPDEHQVDLDEDVPQDIRSRLRSRGSASASTSTSAFDLAVPLPKPKKRAPPKRKSRAKPKKPRVEARYEWSCPVAGCGCVHVSEKIDGVWCNSQGKGAVGVFV
ncbi:hypothetical protein B0H10DRAFT_39693 [Mycena sp. CBHHK59/15]|nr:hypothetical protein B0H10DRAFT_39693 [Mycena sp. CBHHK59/15]